MKKVFICLTLMMFLHIVNAAEPIDPLYLPKDLNPSMVALGKKLFHDNRLSHDNSLSCASCHDLKKGGTDQLPHSIGINKQEGPLNAPTVFNCALNFSQFWDGRAASLEDQCSGPVNNPIEMGSNWKEVISKLSQDKEFVAEFQKAYFKPVNEKDLINAIVTYERSLITESRFDDYLHGNKNAISSEAIRGYELFKSIGCVACHSGSNVGGQMYQKLGLVKDYFADRGHVTNADYGRYNVTHQERDKYYFKVPSLRNSALTFPYFHDGSVKTLDEAVLLMGRYQLGKEIPENDRKAIVAFLQSLTGKGLLK